MCSHGNYKFPPLPGQGHEYILVPSNRSAVFPGIRYALKLGTDFSQNYDLRPPCAPTRFLFLQPQLHNQGSGSPAVPWVPLPANLSLYDPANETRQFLCSLRRTAIHWKSPMPPLDFWPADQTDNQPEFPKGTPA